MFRIQKKAGIHSEKSPNKGMASLVAGIVSASTCENTVNDSRIVTPEIQFDYYQMVAVWSLP